MEYLNEYVDIEIIESFNKLNKIPFFYSIKDDEGVLNKLESIAYFLKNNNYKKPIDLYLSDLNQVVKSYDAIKGYFDSQYTYAMELASYYNIPLTKNNLLEVDEKNLKKQYQELEIQQSGFFIMVSELYRFGILQYSNNTKIQNLLNTLNIPTDIRYKSKKSDSELKNFFNIKYEREKTSELIKYAMRDLYNFFENKYDEYYIEPLDICNEILENFFNTDPKQKRYYTDPIMQTIKTGKYVIKQTNNITKTSSLKNSKTHTITTNKT